METYMKYWEYGGDVRGERGWMWEARTREHHRPWQWVMWQAPTVLEFQCWVVGTILLATVKKRNDGDLVLRRRGSVWLGNYWSMAGYSAGNGIFGDYLYPCYAHSSGSRWRESRQRSKKVWIPNLRDSLHLKGFQKWFFEEHWGWFIREEGETYRRKTELRVSQIEVVSDAKYHRQLSRTEIEKVLFDLLISKHQEFLGSVSVEQWDIKAKEL